MCVCECVRLRVCAGQEKRGTTGHFRKEGRVVGGGLECTLGPLLGEGGMRAILDGLGRSGVGWEKRRCEGRGKNVGVAIHT